MDGDPMIDDEVGAHTRVTVLAYWKFESISLQRRVLCKPNFLGQGPENFAKPDLGDRDSPTSTLIWPARTFGPALAPR
jgi:hypothetical protein